MLTMVPKKKKKSMIDTIKTCLQALHINVRYKIENNLGPKVQKSGRGCFTSFLNYLFENHREVSERQLNNLPCQNEC